MVVNFTLVSAFLSFPSLFRICFAQVATPTRAALLTQATLVTGNLQYKLLGCYSEIITPTGRAVGRNNEYIVPLFDKANSLTVEAFLTACGSNHTPSTRHPYMYAAVEFSKECFCGFTFSNDSVAVDNGFCDSPCSGDGTQSCGGVGYLTLYGPEGSLINPKLNSTSLSAPTTRQGTTSLSSSTSKPNPSLISTSTTTTTTAASSQPPKGLSTATKAGMITGIIVAFLILLALIFLYCRRRRPTHHPLRTYFPEEEEEEEHDNQNQDQDPSSSPNLQKINALRRPKPFDTDSKTPNNHNHPAPPCPTITITTTTTSHTSNNPKTPENDKKLASKMNPYMQTSASNNPYTT